MATDQLVTFDCRPETLRTLANAMTSFGPLEGPPEWLVSAVWLGTAEAQYIATPFAQVLPDGFVARSLHIGTAEELKRHLEAELVRVSEHLLARGSSVNLPPAETPVPAASLRNWPSESYSMHVLVRVSPRPSRTNRVACGLLFEFSGGKSLVVGADPSIMAMILSDDPELVARYRQCCDELTPDEYLALRGA